MRYSYLKQGQSWGEKAYDVVHAGFNGVGDDRSENLSNIFFPFIFPLVSPWV